MKAIVLGSSGGMPTPRRNLPSVCLLREGEMILFDCGEGTQTQIMRKGIGFGRLTKILITHIHGDHVTGYAGLMMTLGLLKHEKSVDVYAPKNFLAYAASLDRNLNLHTKFDLRLHEYGEGAVVEEKDYAIEARRVKHSTPCYGFALTEKDRPGRFHPDRAKALGVPEGPMFGMLQRGETVELEGGVRVTPDQTMGPARRGRKFCYVTDTCFTPDIDGFVRGADLLIHEAMFESSMEEEARERSHCTAAYAATMARLGEVEKLVLTHFSPRYLDLNGHLEEARAIFPNTVLAKDLMEFDIPLPPDEE